MSDSSYRILDRLAPRKATDAGVRRTAEIIRSDLAAFTPRDTGRLAGAWKLQKGRSPGTYLIVNNTPYARAVEFGYGHNAGFMGRTLAVWHARSRR